MPSSCCAIVCLPVAVLWGVPRDIAERRALGCFDFQVMLCGEGSGCKLLGGNDGSQINIQGYVSDHYISGKMLIK